MKNLKLSVIALALTSVLFIACGETKEVKETEIIEVKTTERIIERDNDKIEVETDAKGGKINVELETDKNKIDIELGKGDKK